MSTEASGKHESQRKIISFFKNSDARHSVKVPPSQSIDLQYVSVKPSDTVIHKDPIIHPLVLQMVENDEEIEPVLKYDPESTTLSKETSTQTVMKPNLISFQKINYHGSLKQPSLLLSQTPKHGGTK
jgi:hypothetical protein